MSAEQITESRVGAPSAGTAVDEMRASPSPDVGLCGSWLG